MSVIAIDGPAGAGKTTVARKVAGRLGWQHLDTGAMYRALALAVLEAGADPTSEIEVAAIASGIDVELRDDTVHLGGTDVTDEIRAPRVTQAVAQVSGHARARHALVELQRRMADRRDVVMEGRDIGTEVFPGAGLKIYLTASLAERARRRWSESGDGSVDRDVMERQIAQRDEADSTRDVSPLRKADDAVEIDSSGLSIDSVVGLIVDEARARGLLR